MIDKCDIKYVSHHLKMLVLVNKFVAHHLKIHFVERFMLKIEAFFRFSFPLLLIYISKQFFLSKHFYFSAVHIALSHQLF